MSNAGGSLGLRPGRECGQGLAEGDTGVDAELRVGLVEVGRHGPVREEEALPLFGIPLAAFLVVDLVIGAVRRGRTAAAAS
jgi:hypothetical protein